MKRFWQFVEIRTKIASVLPFLLGTAYAAYAWGRLNWTDTLLFFSSMVLFDMATTAINNTIDSRTGTTVLPYTRPVAVRLVFFLLAAATALGIALAARSGPVVLLTGALCFAVGILYTFGPVPLSRMPLGEVFSGVFMGLVLPFLAIYVNAPQDALVTLGFADGILTARFAVPALIRLGILCVPCMLGIAGIMLANNICDLEHDRAVHRYTLPHYLGVRWSLRLFAALYAVSFAAVAAMAALRVLPPYVLVVLAAAVPVGRNVRTFLRRHSKSETFALSVANLVWMVVPLAAVAAAAALFGGTPA
ncbi:MAG: UbiA family prenyltransferase [Clostridia bacterium]|nr:UbiA family prenyltransferase [Clostridia bacterium]